MKIIDLTNGKRVSVSAYSNGEIRLELWADRSGKGVILTAKEAIRIRAALLAAILDGEKAGSPPRLEQGRG